MVNVRGNIDTGFTHVEFEFQKALVGPGEITGHDVVLTFQDPNVETWVSVTLPYVLITGLAVAMEIIRNDGTPEEGEGAIIDVLDRKELKKGT